MLLLIHPSNRHGEEQGRSKTKKYYHPVRGPVWLLAVTTWIILVTGLLGVVSPLKYG